MIIKNLHVLQHRCSSSVSEHMDRMSPKTFSYQKEMVVVSDFTNIFQKSYSEKGSWHLVFLSCIIPVLMNVFFTVQLKSAGLLCYNSLHSMMVVFFQELKQRMCNNMCMHIFMTHDWGIANLILVVFFQNSKMILKEQSFFVFLFETCNTDVSRTV